MPSDAAKALLHDELRSARAAIVGKLDGVSDHDVWRPLTVTGTNLLGLVKQTKVWEGLAAHLREMQATISRIPEVAKKNDAYEPLTT